MKSIYLSPDKEVMVIYDDNLDVFLLLDKKGEQLTKDRADDARAEWKQPRKYTTKNKEKKDGTLQEANKPLDGMTASDLKEKIQELKAEGQSSAEIAKELKCTLTLVNKYW